MWAINGPENERRRRVIVCLYTLYRRLPNDSEYKFLFYGIKKNFKIKFNRKSLKSKSW